MLAELLAQVQAGGEGLDVLDLRLGDDVEHVFRPLLDEGHEGTVAEGTVGTAEGEVVREGGDRDGEVGYYVSWAPELAEVDALAVNEGEARNPAKG